MPPHHHPSPFPTPAPELYSLLRRAAADYLRESERPGGSDHTLQPTAVVHEALIRVFRTYASPETPLDEQNWWREPRQFFGLCTGVMRHVLIDYARAKATAKRAPQHGAILGSEAADAAADSPRQDFERAGLSVEAIERIGRSINQLREADPYAAEVVELRFYLGLSIPQAAKAMNRSVSSIERDWRAARAWLRTTLEPLDRDGVEASV
jgi:RNA polymerase sigma-70 factor (ECF subfamily)